MESTDVEYDGTISGVYKITIYSSILTFLTLGIYYFWATIKKRKYLASSIILLGDRFEYLGTGKQLFVGFLKSIVIIIILSIPAHIIPFLFSDVITKDNHIEYSFSTNNEYKNSSQNNDNINNSAENSNEKISLEGVNIFKLIIAIVIFLISLLTPIFVLFMAFYGSYRFQIRNIQWRGIHGGVNGSAYRYAVKYFGYGFLVIISLGILYPLFKARLLNYKINHTYFGKSNFKCNLKPIDLYNPIIKYILFPIFIIIVPIFISTNDFLLIFLAALLIVPAFYLHKVTVRKKIAKSIKLDKLHFEWKESWYQLLWFQIVNSSLLFFSLGTARPIVTHRRMKYYLSHLKIKGDIENSEFTQGEHKANAIGEGIGSFFGMDLMMF